MPGLSGRSQRHSAERSATSFLASLICAESLLSVKAPQPSGHKDRRDWRRLRLLVRVRDAAEELAMTASALIVAGGRARRLPRNRRAGEIWA